jgi:hypothetical protein
VINASNYAGKDNPRGAPALTTGAGRPGKYEAGAGRRDRRDLRRASPGRSRIWVAFGLAAGAALDGLTYSLRRRGDRWFAANDTEASWWGWQITKTHGGLGRGYRDPRFDPLADGEVC